MAARYQYRNFWTKFMFYRPKVVNSMNLSKIYFFLCPNLSDALREWLLIIRKLKLSGWDQKLGVQKYFVIITIWNGIKQN